MGRDRAQRCDARTSRCHRTAGDRGWGPVDPAVTTASVRSAYLRDLPHATGMAHDVLTALACARSSRLC